MDFPADFVWGAASSSYQIEGAAFEDGKGLSVWDIFCQRPGVIWNGQSGEVACDHYHRWEEDLALMRQLGLKAYRFSISWPRLMPEGVGRVNSKGLDFYNRLVDGLLQAGITPYATLFHWDYPYELYCRGGWLNRDSPDWFAGYAHRVVEALSDRVRHWITLNEPQCFIGLGHLEGRHAPGDRMGLAQTLRAGHHALLAHGKAVQAIRAAARTAPQVGLAPVGQVRIPASERPEDVEAARLATFSVEQRNCWNNTWWLDPVFLGSYPQDGWQLYGKDVPEIGAGDMEIIRQPLDFFGMNTYHGQVVRRGEKGGIEYLAFDAGQPYTAFRWPVTPSVLYWGPKFFWERYRLPVIVTENGMSNVDWISLDGEVHDPQRIDYLQRHLMALSRACREGVPVQGYFHWSLTDNFEWAEGFKERFGLIHVDYRSQARRLKDSARWYREVIATNGAAISAHPDG